jgi:hypothetical protein
MERKLILVPTSKYDHDILMERQLNNLRFCNPKQNPFNLVLGLFDYIKKREKSSITWFIIETFIKE